MKLRITALLIFVALFCRSVAQPNAVDWTVNDCNNVSHHLFAELDSGKVIVLVWVMPCGLCIGPALTAYNVTQGFVSSGCSVRYYLVDDYANTTCSTLVSWAATNSIGPNITTFVNAAINMQDYGFPGMPKVVVLARNDHFVYYVEDNAITAAPLQNAISQACNDVLNGVNEPSPLSAVNLMPNPATEEFTLTGSAVTEGGLICITDIYGNHIKNIIASHNGLEKISTRDLPAGIYFVSAGGAAAPVRLVVVK